MLSRARRGVCEIVAGAALWRCRCEIVAGAALWRCRCRSRGRRSILCIWVCVCVAGVAFGSCLEGQDVVARAAGGVRNRGRRSTLAMPLRNRGRRSTLAMPLPKSWQAQHSVHLGVCLCGRGRIRQLSRGTGCCRARGGGRAKSWQAQHFGDAVAKSCSTMPLPKSWQAQHSVHLGVCLCGRGRIRQLSRGTRARSGGRAKSWQAQHFGDAVAKSCAKSWQAQHSVHLGVCLCGRGRIRQLSRGTGCCRARGGGCAKSWQAQHFGDAVAKSWQAQHFGDAVAEVVAGAAFCASGCVCLCGRGRIRQLSRGTGCCRARGGGRAKSWQAQHFGDAVAKSWQAQHFGDAVAEVVAGAAFCASGCSVIASIQGAHGTCVWTFELTSLGKT